METDSTLRRIERHSLMTCAALAAVAGMVTGRPEPALGVLGGGALVAISYRGIKAGIVAHVGDTRGVFRLVKFFTRYAILAIVAYVIMARLRLPPMAVLVGASSLVIAVMFEALRGWSQSGRGFPK